jgi:hypothetical protein
MTTNYIPAPEIFLVAAIASLLIFALVPILSKLTGVNQGCEAEEK